MNFWTVGFSLTISVSATFCSFAQSSTNSLSASFNADEFSFSELSQHPYWLKLGHYVDKPLRGLQSAVDKDEFFLAADGKVNPETELIATVENLYSTDSEIAQLTQCQYPARYSWLESLHGREAVLHCPDLKNWLDVLDPEGMTLVFPTAFMNDPSSMFGHTLLRVDAKDQTRHKELVAFAINFAAEPETQDNPALYAMRGLIGSYPGRFAVMPYYRKVREYNDIESRDIWEYKLNFTESEVNRVLLHLWEMQRAEFDYYFLDENCSYQLLALLELARDDLSLITDFPLQAIPSDTVEALAKNGLLETPRYREAFGTRLLHQANEIDQRLFDASIRAKQGEFPSDVEFDEDERAAILEFAYEWLNFELYEDGLDRDAKAKQLTQLLYQRSRIKVDSPFASVPVPEISPEQGHASARVGLGLQTSNNSTDKATLEWRAAYHDLLDSQAGFIPGAQISFLDTQLSIDEDSNTRLDRLYLLDAMSLAPSNRIFNSLAWNVRAGFDRKPSTDKLAGRWFGQAGVGKAWGQADKLHAYSLLSTELSGGQLTQYDATVGIGVEAGLLYQVADQHRIGLQGQYLALIDSNAEQNSSATASWHWTLNRHWAVRSQVSYQHWTREDTSAKLTAYLYY
ncbi:DUF4105 domain-containing protein [Vibrio genomosp. F10 str. 9ZC157]|uniref:Lnb N-terminal periplasmic domain-containing protein n=1 Tax=Vibrio genomosp. F10 TaxID=723171 RepID=UPI00031FCC73|nr:DUF4105 domain-containing protein [Vibrio genomosp. F10]OEE94480.1 hypothetical protein A1QM_18440 [Vibrio genomosp. F10 str. 9ZC157]